MINTPMKPNNISDKQAGEPGEGRPKNSNDKEPRKERVFKPQTGASLQLWAMEAQEKISELLNPYLPLVLRQVELDLPLLRRR